MKAVYYFVTISIAVAQTYSQEKDVQPSIAAKGQFDGQD